MDAFASAEAVFAGILIEKHPVTTDRPNVYSSSNDLVFKVDKTWKGSLEDSVAVVVGLDLYNVTVGEKYLVYAMDYKGRLQASDCARTKPFDTAAEDLSFLSSVPATGTTRKVNRALVTRWIELLNSESEAVRLESIIFLSGMMSESDLVVPSLINVFRGDQDHERAAAVRALSRFNWTGEKAKEIVLAALDDQSPHVRVEAISNLVWVSEDPAILISQWTKALDDPNEEVRFRAAQSLCKRSLDASQVIPALTLALQDESAKVRRQAAESIRCFGSK